MAEVSPCERNGTRLPARFLFELETLSASGLASLPSNLEGIVLIEGKIWLRVAPYGYEPFMAASALAAVSACA